MHQLLRLVHMSIVFVLCSSVMSPASAAPAAYLDSSGRDDVLSGGVKMIKIQTPKGAFRVWTKRVGNNPTIKVLLLHGGPGALSIGARYDTMEPAQMEKIAKSVKKGRYLYCPKGSHLAIYDDQQTYMTGLTQFILDVDANRF
jgi:hypothetical protein